MKDNKVSIVAIIEHKDKENIAYRIMQKLDLGWQDAGNYEHTSKGRIWLMWNPHILDYVIMNETDYFIQSRVWVKESTTMFCFVPVYGLHTTHNRVPVWNHLRVLKTKSHMSMLCMGYFDVVLTSDYRP